MNDSVKVQKEILISFHEVTSSGFFYKIFLVFPYMRETHSQRQKIESNKALVTTKYYSLHF